MRKKLLLRVLSTLLATLVIGEVAQSNELDDLQIIEERYIEDLLELAPSEEVLRGYIKTLDFESGAWSDIDYKCMIGSGWDTNKHPARATELGAYYRKHYDKLTEAERDELVRALHSVWGYWFREKPHCTTNWFPNRLACPRGMTTSFLLMEDVMTAEERDFAEKIVFNKTTIQKTGANLISSANIVLARALFKKDPKLARTAIDAILSTVVVSPRGVEGIQEDNSYHLHGPQQQFGNYGIASLRTGYSTYCNLLRGTSFAFSEKQMEMLTNYLCDGFKWIMWRGYMDINSSGRHYAEGRLASQGEAILQLAERVSRACNDEQRARIEAMIAAGRKENPKVITGHKSFYCSDGVYHHSLGWMSSLKMNSFRVVGGEQGDNNLKGYYIGDGAFYTYVDGDEYEDGMVLWDWYKVPGITCYERDEPVKRLDKGRLPHNQSDFVGDCTDGKSGIATMVLNRDSLYARKTWVVTDDFALCLGSGVGDFTGDARLTTSIEQRCKRGDLMWLDGKRWSAIDGERRFTKGGTRLYHDKSGYIFLSGEEVVASVEQREEDWFKIDRADTPQVVRDDVVTMFVRHKKQPSTYGYLILPARSREEVAAFDTSEVKIYRNDEKLQAVEYRGVYYATVYERGVYKVGDVRIRVVTPAIYMFSRGADGAWSVIGHDPTQNLVDKDIKRHLMVL